MADVRWTISETFDLWLEDNFEEPEWDEGWAWGDVYAAFVAGWEFGAGLRGLDELNDNERGLW